MSDLHQRVLTAIDVARGTVAPWAEWKSAHCDDLRATAERHAPAGFGWCMTCETPESGEASWPCPDYQQVIDRLTAWGALEASDE
jgi:hypothetical protein